MKPIKFIQQNMVYTHPSDMTQDECCDLPVYQDDEEIISCWKMSFKERLKTLFTGKVWFRIFGNQQPPICLETDCPFMEEG